MTLNDCVINCPDVGECDIDIDKAIKAFTEKCFVAQWKETFRLIRIRNKKAVSLKITIKRKDAEKLIRELGLESQRSATFSSARTYRLPSNC